MKWKRCRLFFFSAVSFHPWAQSVSLAVMSKRPYLDAPVKTDKMPPAIPYAVGNEAAERFTFYGLRAILVVFMTQYLMNGAGQKAPMSAAEATEAMHYFLFGVYFLPFVGAILSDAILGK